MGIEDLMGVGFVNNAFLDWRVGSIDECSGQPTQMAGFPTFSPWAGR